MCDEHRHGAAGRSSLQIKLRWKSKLILDFKDDEMKDKQKMKNIVMLTPLILTPLILSPTRI